MFPEKIFSVCSLGQLNLTLKQEIQKKETYCFRHFFKLMSHETIKVDINKHKHRHRHKEF